MANSRGKSNPGYGEASANGSKGSRTPPSTPSSAVGPNGGPTKNPNSCNNKPSSSVVGRRQSVASNPSGPPTEPPQPSPSSSSSTSTRNSRPRNNSSPTGTSHHRHGRGSWRTSAAAVTPPGTPKPGPPSSFPLSRMSSKLGVVIVFVVSLTITDIWIYMNSSPSIGASSASGAGMFSALFSYSSNEDENVQQGFLPPAVDVGDHNSGRRRKSGQQKPPSASESSKSLPGSSFGRGKVSGAPGNDDTSDEPSADTDSSDGSREWSSSPHRGSPARNDDVSSTEPDKDDGPGRQVRHRKRRRTRLGRDVDVDAADDEDPAYEEVLQTETVFRCWEECNSRAFCVNFSVRLTNNNDGYFLCFVSSREKFSPAAQALPHQPERDSDVPASAGQRRELPRQHKSFLPHIPSYNRPIHSFSGDHGAGVVPQQSSTTSGESRGFFSGPPSPAMMHGCGCH